jgi:hypothetical protein
LGDAAEGAEKAFRSSGVDLASFAVDVSGRRRKERKKGERRDFHGRSSRANEQGALRGEAQTRGATLGRQFEPTQRQAKTRDGVGSDEKPAFLSSSPFTQR